jgi:hypothetical protein
MFMSVSMYSYACWDNGEDLRAMCLGEYKHSKISIEDFPPSAQRMKCLTMFSAYTKGAIDEARKNGHNLRSCHKGSGQVNTAKELAEFVASDGRYSKMSAYKVIRAYYFCE